MRSDVDMTSGSLGWKILKYAIPLAVTGMLQQFFNAAEGAGPLPNHDSRKELSETVKYI